MKLDENIALRLVEKGSVITTDSTSFPTIPSRPLTSLRHYLVPVYHNSSGFLFHSPGSLTFIMADCKLLQYVCFCLVVFVQNVGAVTSSCKKLDDCSCRTNDGKTLDLKPVDKDPGPR